MANTPSNVSDELYAQLREKILGRAVTTTRRADRIRELPRTFEPRIRRRQRSYLSAESLATDYTDANFTIRVIRGIRG